MATLEELELNNLNGNALRNAIAITPIVPDSIVAQIEKAIKDGKTFDYYPTHYLLALNNGALGISITRPRHF